MKEIMSIEPRLVQFEVREIESARLKIKAFEENCKKRNLTELKRTKRRYEKEMDEARRDLLHRERRLEARAAHYEQMYGGVVEEAVELEDIVARELEYRHMGENTIREMQDALNKQKDMEEISVRKVEDEIRVQFESSQKESEKKWRHELESPQRSHYLALEDAEREYEKKLSEMQIKYTKERSDLCQQADNERVRVAQEMKRQSTKLRDFLKSNLSSSSSMVVEEEESKKLVVVETSTTTSQVEQQIEKLRSIVLRHGGGEK